MFHRLNTSVIRAAIVMLVVLATGAGACAGDPAVQAVVDLVSRTNYQTYHLDIENMGLGLYGGPQYDMGLRNRDGWAGPGTLGNQEARLYLQDAFADLGLGVSVQGVYSNVVGELPGTTTPEKVYILGAHYDHVAGDRPGGDDNASGTAGILEAARVLSRFRFDSTIRFIGFNAEEDGLKGSKDYVNKVLVPGGENIAGMVNLDMILRPGSDANPDAVIDADLETRANYPASGPWCHAYQQAAADYVPTLTVDPTIAHYDAGYSDHDPFVLAGFPAFMVIENSGTDWDGANSYYHRYEDASDRLANDPNSPSGVTYDYDFATDITRAAVGLLAQEAGIATILSDFDPADFDEDGDIDLLDVDALTAVGDLAAGVIVSPGRAGARFDLDGDGTVGTADLDQWLTDAGVSHGLGVPYLEGDANIDGDVDVWALDGSGDAQVLSSNLGTIVGAVWSDGDFNGDGDVDIWAFDGSGDAQVLSASLGSITGEATFAQSPLGRSAMAVPEPSTFAMLIVLGMVGVFRRRRMS